MLQPKEISIECQDGGFKTFILSKFDAIAGREIITQYPISAIPKLGDYKTNEAMMLKIMGYVAVPITGGNMLLSSKELVSNHVPDYECLMRLEWAMIEYNVSFLTNGKASTFFDLIVSKAQVLFSQMLTDSLARSPQKDKPPSTN